MVSQNTDSITQLPRKGVLHMTEASYGRVLANEIQVAVDSGGGQLMKHSSVKKMCFLFPPGCDVDVMAGAQAAILGGKGRQR